MTSHHMLRITKQFLMTVFIWLVLSVCPLKYAAAENGIFLAKIVSEDTILYLDPEMTTEGYLALTDTEYIVRDILSDMEREVVCIEILDETNNTIPAYVYSSDVEIYEQILEIETEIEAETEADIETEKDEDFILEEQIDEPETETVQKSEDTWEQTEVIEEAVVSYAEQMDVPELIEEITGIKGIFLAAQTGDRLLIQPMIVHYSAGETIQSMLEKIHGHRFALEQDGAIRSIDELTTEFLPYSEDGPAKMSDPAENYTFLIFSDHEVELSEGWCALLQSMAEYNNSAAAKENEEAVGIYAQILERYLTLSDTEAKEWANRLMQALLNEDEPERGDIQEPEMADGYYQITTGGEMKWFADLVNGELEERDAEPEAKAELKSNISIAGRDWQPIGNPERPFQGVFDGNDYRISGLSIHSDASYQALFGYLGENGEIKNLTVSGTVESSGDYCAGIVAFSEAPLQGLHNKCDVFTSGRDAGGVAGAIKRAMLVQSCTNQGQIYSSYSNSGVYIGGIAGEGGIYSDCHNSGSIYGAGQLVGGIAGQTTLAYGISVTISKCSNKGEVQAGYGGCGGIAGGAGNITDCTNYGTVSVTGHSYGSTRYLADRTGGIVGGVSNMNISVDHCVNYGTVTFCFDGESTTIQNMGGIIGFYGTVSDCINYGNVYACGYKIGGIGGSSTGASTGKNIGPVLRCQNYGNVVNTSAKADLTGGITGSGSATACLNAGDVYGGSNVGGIIGGGRNVVAKDDAGNIAVIQSCYNLGMITGKSAAGGIAGRCKTATDCYDAGDVYCEDTVVGPIAGGFVSVENCYYPDIMQTASKAGIPVSAPVLRTSLIGAPYYKLNFNPDYHYGFPVLEFENTESSTAVREIVLPEGTAKEFYTTIGHEPGGLPERALVRAGGLEFSCKIETWVPEETYDNQIPGNYTFTPALTLPEGCYLDDHTQIQSISVTVAEKELLPLVTAIRLEEGTSFEYYTAYGKEPEDLPGSAYVTVEGEERSVPITWIPEDPYDLTDTENPIVYTLTLLQEYRISEDVVLPQITVHVLPLMWIDQLHFTTNQNEESRRFDLTLLGTEKTEDAIRFHYNLEIMDSSGFQYTSDSNYADGVCVWTKAAQEAPENLEISCFHKSMDWEEKLRTVNLYPARTYKKLYLFAPRYADYIAENDLTIEASALVDGAEQKQYYLVHSRIHPTLETLTAKAGSSSLYLDPALDRYCQEYTYLVPSSEKKVDLTMKTVLSAEQVQMTVDGEAVAPDSKGLFQASVPFEGEEKEIRIVLSNPQQDGSFADTEYTVCLKRPAETRLQVRLDPEDALFRISSTRTGAVQVDEDGNYTLIQGYNYEYTAMKQGYVTQSGSIMAAGDSMALELSLQKAPENTSIITDLESQWNNFRGNENNNAVTNALTPISQKNALLYWANKAGSEYGSDAVSSPILVDGYLICTVKNNILKIDTVSGEIVAVGDMVTSSVFNITPPTYAEGMIFVALAGGRIQAFNADTLESLWVYTAPLGGQPNSPITYADGYIYTGFWGTETSDCNYVCLSVTDEKPNSTLEAKTALWTYTQKGGFYWAGAYVSDQFMLVGTDDGRSGYTSNTAKLLSLNPKTGQTIDSLDDIRADVRSTICYDTVTGRYYFTSKAGYFYSIEVSPEGQINHDTVKILDLKGNRTGDDGKTPVEGMSTSTPVVYNGRAYVGVSGVGQFNAYNGHCIAVIDLEKWEIAYTCPTKGYPQTSGLLTNGYEEDGKVYLYFFENASPGTLRIICDSPGQTEPISVESGKTISRTEDIFTPRGAQRQFALCSPIVDEYGTIYFKNDSGYMMALGSTIEQITVAQKPDKLRYEEGETFDPSGMQVTASYSNGLTRDITKYVSYTKDPLSAEDTDITISFDHVMYNNISEVIDPPHAVVNLTIFSAQDTQNLNHVLELIERLGDITLDSEEMIFEARKAYDALRDVLKGYVTNYGSLTAAEEAFDLLERAEQGRIRQVIRLIDAIGEVSLDSGDTIQTAMEAYEGLTDYGKVRVTNYAALLEAQKEYQILVTGRDPQAAAVMKQISELSEITLESGASITEARTAYDRLSENSKKRVTNYAVLTAVEKTYQELLQDQADQASAVTALIGSIGKVTLEKEQLIQKAREAYDRLDAAATAQVTNTALLIQAETDLAALKERQKALSATIAQLDQYMEQIKTIVSGADQITAENAGQVAAVISQMDQLIQSCSAEERELLADASAYTKEYRNAIGSCVHTDTKTGITVDGLTWNQMVSIEVLVSGEADYTALQKGLASADILKAYRVQIIDLLTGTVVSGHKNITLQYEIPVPAYNDSAYPSIGVAAMSEGGTVQAVSSSYTDHKRKLAFAVIGDGVIAVAGAKAEMNAGDSHESSGSVLDGPGTGSEESAVQQSGTTGIQGNGNGNGSQQAVSGNHANANNGSVASSGSVLPPSGSIAPGSGTNAAASGSAIPKAAEKAYAATAGGTAYTSQKQAVLNDYYGSVIESGKWEYQKVVIPPVLLSALSDEQVMLYENLSLAVENGDPVIAGSAVTEKDLALVMGCYRQTNPLQVLVKDVQWEEEKSEAVITYLLSEKDHKLMIDEWHAKIELIVTYCLKESDEVQTAASIYQYLTTHLKPYLSEEAEKIEEAEGIEDIEETEPVNTKDVLKQFSGTPFYGLMEEQIIVNDAASDYAYLLMQTGIECMLLKVDLAASDKKTESEMTVDMESESETETISEMESESEFESIDEVEHIYHRWTALCLEGIWYHADPELDIAMAAGTAGDADVMGHFGMDDTSCRQALGTQNTFIVTGRPDREAPVCAQKLAEFGMTQDVVRKEESSNE